MKTIFRNKRISGILGVLPQNEYNFDNEVEYYDFPVKQTLRLKKVMGFDRHRLVKETTATSDLCIYGLNYLLNNKVIDKEQIGAVIVVTLTPDYFVPQISNIIQDKCGLGKDTLCLDIAQGCVGYLVGLMQAFMVLDMIKDKKVLLFNGDVLSKAVSRSDRNSYPLTGDAAAVTIVENDEDAKDIYFNLYMDGTKREALMIPAGGWRMPTTAETIQQKKDDSGNIRSLNNMKMDGSGIFNFVQQMVPDLINENLSFAGVNKEDTDYFLFHQPNKFMLSKLADKLEIPHDKMFMNIVEKYGNSSGATIPVNIACNLRDIMREQMKLCCLAGFGSGLAWGAMTLELGCMDFCDLIESDL